MIYGNVLEMGMDEEYGNSRTECDVYENRIDRSNENF